MEKLEKLTVRQFLAILAAGLFAFCGILIETATNITFPTLIKEFNVATSTVQWMTTGNLLAMGILIPLSSYLDKRFAKKQLFLFAGGLFVSGIIIDVFTNNFGLLLLGRIIQGGGVGIALPLMYNIILSESPNQMLGRMIGMGSLVIASAPALGPTFGGLMIEYFSWRYIFLAVLPLIGIALVIGSLCIKNNKANKNVKIDWIGFAAIAIAFCALMFAFSNLDKIVTKPELVIFYLLLGIGALYAFIKNSLASNNPLIDLAIFTQRSFDYHLGAIMALQITTLALSLLLPIYVQSVLGESAVAAGLVALPGSIIGAIFAPIGGMLLDKYGPRIPLMAGALFSTMAVGGFLVFFNNLNYMICTILYFFYMLGVGLSVGNTLTCALNKLAASQKTDGNATIQTLQQLAGGIGTAICAASLAFFQNGNVTAATTATGSLFVLVFLTITMIALVVCQGLAMKRVKNTASEKIEA